MTTKQRAALRSMCNTMEPVLQIGKDGITDNLVKQCWDALEARELIKISVLTNAENEAKETGAALAEALKADCVAVIGRKVILYRRSSRKEFEHVEF